MNFLKKFTFLLNFFKEVDKNVVQYCSEGDIEEAAFIRHFLKFMC